MYQEIICMGNTLPWLSNDTEVDHARPTSCALAAPPLIDGNDIVADTSAEKGTISLDAQRRPLQARVRRLFGSIQIDDVIFIIFSNYTMI